MNKTKQDVEKHVKDVLSRIVNEEERTLKGLVIARLYCQVKDFETAKRYLAGYLNLRDENADAHSLMGHIYENLRDWDRSLQSYKRSLLINQNQKNIILKICELHCSVHVDPDRARYWADRAEALFPNHPTVFNLREIMLKVDGEPNMEELENLIAQELAVKPLDFNLRIKLLQLYLHNERNVDAYAHTVEVLKRRPDETNLDWLYCVNDVFEAYQEERGSECGQIFYTYLLENLDQLVYLSLEEAFGPRRGSPETASRQPKSLMDCCCALHQFDQQLYKAHKLSSGQGGLWKMFLKHMQGQLYFHMATIVLKRVKDHGSVKEASLMAAALLLTAYSVKPLEFPYSWHVEGQEDERKCAERLFKQACFRMSQSGHVIMGLCHEEPAKWLGTIAHTMFMQPSMKRMTLYVFQQQDTKSNAATSYFMNDEYFMQMAPTFPDIATLQEFDRVASKLHPSSLHHFVWLAAQSYSLRQKVQPDYGFNAFQGLSYDESNTVLPIVGQALCTMDVDAFLYATVRTTLLCLDSKRQSLKMSNFLPVHVSELLCTAEQAEWWRVVFELNSSSIGGNFGGARRKLEHGIGVIRATGNHGMDVGLVVHLAETFRERGAEMKSQSDNDPNKERKSWALEHRAARYWAIAIEMLQKLEKNQTLMCPTVRMFPSLRRDPDTEEVRRLLQDGRFYLAYVDMNDGNLEKAYEGFKTLTTPYASYYQAVISKKLASKEIGNQTRDSVTSNMRSTHIILLTKARDALYETMDRVARDKKHPLNAVLLEEIEDIETKLARIDPDTAATREYAVHSNGTVSTRDEDDQELDNVQSNGELASRFLTFNSSRRTAPEINSTPKTREERVRPSPERLDAQLRVLANSQDVILQKVAQNSDALVEISRAMSASVQQNAEALTGMSRALMESLRQNGDAFLEMSRAITSSMQKSETVVDISKAILGSMDQNAKLLDELKLQLGDFCRQVPILFARRLKRRIRPSAGENEKPALGSGGDQQSDYDGYYYQMDEEEYGDADDNDGGDAANDGYAYGASTRDGGAGHDVGLAAPVPIQQNLAYYPRGPLIEAHQLPVVPTVPLGPSYYHHPVMPLQTGLNFSEGQKLPHFNFTMGQGLQHPPPPHSLLKPSVFSRLGEVAQVPKDAVEEKTEPENSADSDMTEKCPASVEVPAQDEITTVGVPTDAADDNAASAVDATKLAGFSFTGLLAPHAFQIPLPPQSATVNLDVPVSRQEPSTRDPITCNLFANIWSPSGLLDIKTPDGSPRVRKDSEEGEVGDESSQDFKPLIPLPEEVEVNTGEEGEIVLFEDKARLYRFVDKEWKERGVGTIKLLHDEAKARVRVLMRRDQTLKICANHHVLPDMEPTPFKNSDRAWLWAARDFADEKMTEEKFCLRLKNAEVAQKFKTVFDKSREIVKVGAELKTTAEPLEPSKGFGEKFKPAPGSWTCDTCYVSNESSKSQCVACESPRQVQTPVMTGFGDKFAPAPGSWQCDVCLVRNTAEKVKCVACESPKTGVASGSTCDKCKAVIEAKDGKCKSCEGSKSSSNPPVSTGWATNFQGFGTLTGVSPFKFGFSATPTESKTPVVTPAKDFVFGRQEESKPSGYVFGQSPVKPGVEPSPKKDEAEKKPVIMFGGFTFNSDPVLKICEPQKTPKQDVKLVTLENPFMKMNFGAGKVTDSPTVKLTTEALAETPIRSPKSDEDFVPNVDFKPVIPLPELVDLKTGEEDEEEYFTSKARLYRYILDSKQWKEKGVGDLKILRHRETGRPRLIMRRDQILKVCANHYVTDDMNPKLMVNKKKVMVWVANDFSEGVVTQEMLAAKFETDELAQDFKTVVEKAKEEYKEKMARKETESSNAEDQYFDDDDYEDEDDDEEEDDDDDEEDTGHVIGPDSAPSSPQVTLPVSSSSAPLVKPDFNFQRFKFNPLSTTTPESDVGFRFGGPQQFNFSFGGVTASPSKSAKSPGGSELDEESNVSAVSAESEADNVFFQPVIPLPNKVEVRTGEEDEETLYSQRAKLFRMLNGEWKERGVGDLKILRHKESGILRLLMRRDQVLKICCNHLLTKELEFRAKDEKSYVWCAQDFADGVVQQETLAIRFSSGEIAQKFIIAVDEARGLAMKPEAVEAKSFSFKLADDSPSKSLFSFGGRFGDVSNKSLSDNSFGSPVSTVTIPKPSVKSDSSDVDIISVETATPEQQEKARKLMLPVNFYLHLNAPPCPGCRGCESDDGLEEVEEHVVSPMSKPDSKPADLRTEEADPSSAASEVTQTPTNDKSEKSGLEPLQSSEEVTFFTKSELENVSFASLAQTSSTFTSHSDGQGNNFKFSGAGASVFGGKSATERKDGSDNDDDADESHGDSQHDPHFEPIVQLPDIVEVKTGEENEAKLYSQRCKLYRFDSKTKQWKERGVGEMKIMTNVDTGRFRLIMRREQVFKVVCNHYLTADMQFSPMSTSENSWIWSAIDFSTEESGQLESLAVRFKNTELAKEFKDVIDKCQEKLREV